MSWLHEPDFPLSGHDHEWHENYLCFHPHHAKILNVDSENKADPEKPSTNFIWNARDHRKGRHPIPDDEEEKRQKQKRIVWLNWDPQNISWLVAFCFTVGSVVWCANAVLVFLPEVRTDYADNVAADAWTAWVGGTIFLFSSYLGILEALNRGSEVDFGQAVHNLHHTSEKPSASAQSSVSPPPYASHTKDIGIFRRRQHLLLKERSSTEAHWHWFGARWKEIGYTAAVIQQVCAVIFWIAVVTGLPGCLPVELSGTALANGVYWLPQVLGGLGFVIAPGMQMLEAQEHWWKPALFKVGWWAAAWNCFGGIGFTLCGILGFGTSSQMVYESLLWTFLGSWAFLIGSYLQLFEAMNPDPIMVPLLGKMR